MNYLFDTYFIIIQFGYLIVIKLAYLTKLSVFYE